jgi:hypothetical protein
MQINNDLIYFGSSDRVPVRDFEWWLTHRAGVPLESTGHGGHTRRIKLADGGSITYNHHGHGRNAALVPPNVMGALARAFGFSKHDLAEHVRRGTTLAMA